jgi:RP/EB family microtubule-associated protein
MEPIGGTDSGYFVSRQVILQWINNTLSLTINQIEQLSNGAVYCQLIDSLYPGHIQLNRVNWKAKQDYESLQNYKLLQAAFDRLGIDKKIEVILA